MNAQRLAFLHIILALLRNDKKPYHASTKIMDLFSARTSRVKIGIYFPFTIVLS